MRCGGMVRRRRLAGMIPTTKFFSSLLALAGAATILLSGSHAAAQDWAKAQLEKSPRHGEYVTVEHDGRKVTTFVVYPEVKTKGARGGADPRNLWRERLVQAAGG